jgi:hypothetical protein
MAELGRKKLPIENKKIQVLVGCYLTHKEISALGGIDNVRQVFQKAGKNEIENLLFLKSKVQ